ncbi:hypothetical protein HDZ31DRAFT_65203 [Schizophyllum fasciatum]
MTPKAGIDFIDVDQLPDTGPSEDATKLTDEFIDGRIDRLSRNQFGDYFKTLQTEYSKRAAAQRRESELMNPSKIPADADYVAGSDSDEPEEVPQPVIPTTAAAEEDDEIQILGVYHNPAPGSRKRTRPPSPGPSNRGNATPMRRPAPPVSKHSDRPPSKRSRPSSAVQAPQSIKQPASGSSKRPIAAGYDVEVGRGKRRKQDELPDIAAHMKDLKIKSENQRASSSKPLTLSQQRAAHNTRPAQLLPFIPDPPNQDEEALGSDFDEDRHEPPCDVDFRNLIFDSKDRHYATQKLDDPLFVSDQYQRSRSIPSFAAHFGLGNLCLSERFRDANGAINRIIQKGAFAAYCSYVDGGGVDSSEPGISAYNQDHDGSLVFLQRDPDVFPHLMRDEHDQLPGHFLKKAKRWPKQYTVTDIAFVPSHTPESYYSSDDVIPDLVSAGCDKRVLLWTPRQREDVLAERASAKAQIASVLGSQDPSDLEATTEATIQDIEQKRKVNRSKYYELATTYGSGRQKAPQVLKFRPGHPDLLAVGADHLEIIPLDDETPIESFSVTESRQQNVSAIAWGVGPSKEYIFASTDPDDGGDPPPICSHKGFNIETGASYKLISGTSSDSGIGDALAIDELGERLAIVTRCVEGHVLQVHNIRAPGTREKPIHRLALPPFDFGVRVGPFQRDVSVACFAPDASHLLALARSDNSVLLYDLRKTSRLLHTWTHQGCCGPENQDFNGVTHAQWVSGKRLGLVTSGADGCVRIWDHTNSENDLETNILARIDRDISTFSLGERGTKEHSLIIGDSRGAIHIYNQGYRGPATDLIPV